MSDLKTFIILYDSRSGESTVTEYGEDAALAQADFIKLEQDILEIEYLQGNLITIDDRESLEKFYPQFFFKNKK